MRHLAIAIALLSVFCGCTTIPERDGRITVQQKTKTHPPEIDIRRILPQQDPSRYWRLRSQMTTADVESKFTRREWVLMRLGELSRELGSVPLGTLDTIVFALADGTLTCELDRDYLQSWQVRKDPPKENRSRHDVDQPTSDPHRNAYFRVTSYGSALFLKVPLDDVHAAIRRAENATYSDLVDHYLDREHKLFIHGCSCKFCRRPITSVTDPVKRAALEAHHNARSQALRSLATKLDARGIQPPSHLKPLVIERSPHAHVKLYIPLEHINQVEQAEQSVAPATSKPAAFQATASEAGER